MSAVSTRSEVLVATLRSNGFSTWSMAAVLASGGAAVMEMEIVSPPRTSASLSVSNPRGEMPATCLKFQDRARATIPPGIMIRR